MHIPAWVLRRVGNSKFSSKRGPSSLAVPLDALSIERVSVTAELRLVTIRSQFAVLFIVMCSCKV